MSNKIDFKKTLKHLFNPGIRGFHIVEVPKMNFLMVNGIGDPNVSERYQQAVEGLYSMSYGIKFALKSQETDYIVPPLEGLWWMDNMEDFTLVNRPLWEWTMMIMQPDWVTNKLVEKVKVSVFKKKKLPIIPDIRFKPYAEGKAVQILYTGEYKDEAPTIAMMHDFINDNGYLPDGKHHEIYLGDPRKTSPDKLQTILRQPVRLYT